MKALKITSIIILAIIIACATFIGIVYVASLINGLKFYGQWKAWFGPLLEPAYTIVKTLMGK